MKTNRNINMNRIGQRFFALLLAPLILSSLFLAACDSTSGLSGDDSEIDTVASSISFMVSDLSLSSSQTDAINASFAKHSRPGGSDSDQEAGYLWRVAADLHATLSDEEKAALYERIAQAGQRDRQKGQMRPGGQSLNDMRRQGGGGGALAAIGLTDEQQAQIEALRETYKPQVEAILAQRESLSREEIKAQLDAIHEAVRAQVEALLTDEQKQALADGKAEGEAARAEHEALAEAHQGAARLVMIEVLGLTDEQVAALDALKASSETDRASVRELIESGAAQEDVMALVESLKAAHEAAIDTILDDTQFEITMIHNALASRMGGHGGQGGPGGRGHGGPGMGGPGGQRPGGHGGPGGQRPGSQG